MKKRGIVRIVLALLIVLSPVVGAAGKDDFKWRGSGGWGAGLPYSRAFDPAAVQTIEGEIVRLERLTPRPGMAEGVGLLLRNGAQNTPVHLGPVWYLERQDFSLQPKDWIEVTGSRIDFSGENTVIACTVVKNDTVLSLRENNGYPLWSAWRGR